MGAVHAAGDTAVADSSMTEIFRREFNKQKFKEEFSGSSKVFEVSGNRDSFFAFVDSNGSSVFVRSA
jgi:hypothetical protein